MKTTSIRYLDLLEAGTLDPDTAANWHRHAIPHIEKQARELEELQQEIATTNDVGLLPFANELQDDINRIKSVLATFFQTWPAPIDEIIQDTVNPVDEIPATWWQLSLHQSAPLKPLTLRNSSKDAWLFYEDIPSGAVFKVPNMWYNQPGRRVKTTWASVYAD